MLKMIDQSAYQGSYWTAAALRINDIQVVAIKATEGTDWFSQFYAWQVDQAHLAGCAVMHYHLSHPEANSASSEFAYFNSRARVMPGDLVMLDCEPQIYDLVPATAASTWTGQWADDVRSQWGMWPVIYSAGSTIGNGALESVRNKAPLFYAYPGANPASPPAPPRPWLVSFLQYGTNPNWSSAGTDVDVAYFPDLSHLAALARPPHTITVTVTASDKSTGLSVTKTGTFKRSWL